MQSTKSLHPERFISLFDLSRPDQPASLPIYSRIRHSSSIAAPATASAFLLVSLSKMPRGRNSAELPEYETRPEAFPIKANDYSAACLISLVDERFALMRTWTIFARSLE